MAARAYWQGQIRLALVSIPVEVYAATKSGASISFRQIHEPSGKPIKYEKVVQGLGPIDRDDIVKGYEISKGNYVLLEEDEIEAVKIESRKTLELVQFVDADEIDVFYFEKPYFVVPQDELAEEAFVVLREALRQKKKVALGQLSVRGRETLVSLKPCGKGIVLETLRYEDEVRRAQTYFKDIPDSKPDKEMLELAGTLIDKKSAPFDAGEFRDRYVDAIRKLIDKKAKAKGKKVLEDVEEPAPSGKSNVIDLMAALKKSVKEDKPAAESSSKKASAKKSSSSKARKRA
ncbi:non-homologous end joining protein Ku [Pelagerythrobacter aerophilus]|uniref:Non-homologous end joining protein Ku n=1 Tax=Pelagerythrobacter aerophilus TaxID=2306995 RepID=A0A418NDD7_9SPHN|nr:Ku protein [Pelagerythrobacter aerophilus]RIV75519.1 Ku protein [Pelagerythrobacter aerophilus]